MHPILKPDQVGLAWNTRNGLGVRSISGNGLAPQHRRYTTSSPLKADADA
jgi:hypothetical protein